MREFRRMQNQILVRAKMLICNFDSEFRISVSGYCPPAYFTSLGGSRGTFQSRIPKRLNADLSNVLDVARSLKPELDVIEFLSG